MNRPARITAALGVILLAGAAAVAARADDEETRPVTLDRGLHSWRQWKVGAKVVLDVSIAVDGAPAPRGSQKMEIVLSAKDAESFDLTRAVTDATGAAIGSGELHETVKRIGEEEVTIAGAATKTVKWEIDSAEADHAETNWVWIAEGAPGLVKIETKSADGSAIRATAKSLEPEKLTVAGESYDCIRLEGDLSMPTGSPMAAAETKLVIHACDAVPGGVVRMRIDLTADGRTVTRTIELGAVEGERAE